MKGIGMRMACAVPTATPIPDARAPSPEAESSCGSRHLKSTLIQTCVHVDEAVIGPQYTRKEMERATTPY